MKNTRIVRALLAGVCALSLSGAVVAIASPAQALVDETKYENRLPQHNPAIGGRTATQVYELKSTEDFGPSQTIKVVDVFNGSTSQGAAVGLWTRGTPNDGPSEVAQQNQSWEFIPRADNTGGEITTGYGQLRGRQSGLCLDITGGNSAVDGAAVSQHPCHDGANQQFRFHGTYGGVIQSAPFANGHTWFLERGHNGCQAASGDPLTATTTPTTQSCDSWMVQKVAYRFATRKQWGNASAAEVNHYLEYRCLSGYAIPMGGGWGPPIGWNLSDVKRKIFAQYPNPDPGYNNDLDRQDHTWIRQVRYLAEPVPPAGLGSKMFQAFFVCDPNAPARGWGFDIGPDGLYQG